MSAAWQPPDPLAHLPTRIPRDRAQFRADVGWALSVCREQPMLPLLSLAIGLAPLVSTTGQHRHTHGGVVTSTPPSAGHQLVSFAVTMIVLALAGWPGTQRLWFLRAARGRSLSVADAVSVTFRYFGRFVVLGLALAALFTPLFIAVAIWFAVNTERLPDGTVVTPAPRWRFYLLIGLATLVIDVACTFVTPAIVFTSHRVRDALRIGLRLLRATWPSTAPYVVIPPLVAVALALYSGLGPELSIPLVAASTLLNLVVKGATAAYYLRVLPPPWPNGAITLPAAYDPHGGPR